MSRSVDELRAELRGLGYMSRGVERWFALDPFRSTTFWRELLIVAVKTGILLAPFALAPLLFILVWRNRPMQAGDIILTGAAWLIPLAAAVVILISVVALALRSRATAAVEHPRVLTIIAAGTAGLSVAMIALWWSGFETPADPIELAAGALLLALFFVVSSLGYAAALLSFSIFETGRIPTIRHTSSLGILSVAAIIVVALIALPEAFRGNAAPVQAPTSIAVRPSDTHLLMIAADGLTPDLARGLTVDGARLLEVPATSASVPPPEMWATLATGVDTELHGVRAIEGVRLITGRLLQEVSMRDAILRVLLPATGLARLQPLPPSVRRRHYVWELVASRGIPARSANWWASSTIESPTLTEVGQDVIFTRASRAAAIPLQRALLVDSAAAAEVRGAGERLVAVYLPALDVLTNRLEVAERERSRAAARVVSQIEQLAREFRARGFEILIVGSAGSQGRIPVLTTLPGAPRSAADIAPTVLDAFGFPRSTEMRGRSWLPNRQAVIGSFGARGSVEDDPAADPEYYESLRSLGYIQ